MNEKSYWDSISKEYDGLYDSYWSRIEDLNTRRLLTERIGKIYSNNSIKVVDICCGSGLGFRLIKDIHNKINYTGIDFSIEMLNIFRKHNVDVNLICASATDGLISLQPCSVDYVFAINTSASFPPDTHELLLAIDTVLKPNGHFTLSFLNKGSLRRFFARQKAYYEIYKTRGHKGASVGVRATVMNRDHFYDLLRNTQLCLDHLEYHSTLGGVWETKTSMLIEKAISKIIPCLGHEIIFSGVKNEKP